MWQLGSTLTAIGVNKKYWEILQREFFKDENVIAFDSPDYEPLYQAVALLKEK